MAKRHLLDPEGARKHLLKCYAKQCCHWLVDDGEWPLRLTLGVPTEQQTVEQLTQVRDWQTRWRNWQGPAELVWVERHWKTLGRQNIPQALVFDSAEAVAAFVSKKDEWSQVCRRFQEIISLWPGLTERLPGYFAVLAQWNDTEYKRLLQVVQWLESHPHSNIYIRQLPIPGVDSKWLEKRQSVVCDWLKTISRAASDGDLYDLTGLRRLPVTLRLRLLDPDLRSRMGGVSDNQAAVSELATLQLPIEKVFIVENLQTGLAFDDLPGTLVFMKQGYAVDLFGELPWLKSVPCYYWGDIDTHGFAILDRLRHYLPEVRSLLMDSETLLLHRELWSNEEKPANLIPGRLTKEEKELFDGLSGNRWGSGVRLEQERIDWGYAVENIRKAI